MMWPRGLLWVLGTVVALWGDAFQGEARGALCSLQVGLLIGGRYVVTWLEPWLAWRKLGTGWHIKAFA